MWRTGRGEDVALKTMLFSSVGAIDDSLLLMLFWVLAGLSVLGLFSQRSLTPFTIALILRSIYHLGIGNTLIVLGTLNVRKHHITHLHPGFD